MSARYSKKEDEIIIREIRKSPNNLKNAFRVASEKLNRAPEAICVHYYHNLRKKTNIFTIVTDKGNVMPFNYKSAHKIKRHWILSVYTTIKDIFKKK